MTIYAAIRDWDPDAEGELRLPDEPPEDPTQIQWSAGAMDGVFGHHLGPAGPTGLLGRLRHRFRRRPGPETALVEALVALVRDPGESTYAEVYASATDESGPQLVDEVLAAIMPAPALLQGLGPHARRLVTESVDRGPVKLGLALLGVCGSPDDVPLLTMLARHDEFTLYAVVALTNLVSDPVDALWEIARTVNGWGKVQTVERLAPLSADRADVRRWLLVDGCQNAVMDGYLAYTCATHGHLADALEGTPDEALIDGACAIVSALLEGGPAEDIDDYNDAPVVIERLLRLLASDCRTLPRLTTVIELDGWIEEHADPDLGELRREILAQAHWPELVHAASSSGSRLEAWLAWRVASHVGVDLWDDGFARLQRSRLDDGLVYHLMVGADPSRQARVLAWAEQHLPLDRIASEPTLSLFIAGAGREPEAVLVILVQEMAGVDDEPGAVYSAPLVAAALRAPVIATRSIALRVLESRPPSTWGTPVEAALARAAEDDPDVEVRARAQALRDLP